MGKLSRKKTFDGKTEGKQQQKISSFFDNKSTTKQGSSSSKLFTSITKTKKLVAPESGDSGSSKSTSNGFGGFRPELLAADSPLSCRGNDEVVCIEDQDDEKVTKNCVNKKEVDSDVVKNGLKSEKSEIETCKVYQDDIINVTPSKFTQGPKTAVSPDVICNTPGMENSFGGVGMRFKGKPAGRSFLRPFHLVTKQPDLKPSEARLNAKRKTNKTAGPVSVVFNSSDSSKLKGSLGDGDDKECTKTRKDESINESNFVYLKNIVNVDHCERSNLEEGVVCDQGVLTSANCSKDKKKKEMVKTTKPTPTKSYQSDLGDMIKVKRMSTPGLSPASKRPVEELMNTTTEISHANFPTDTDSEKVKRKLNLDSKSADSLAKNDDLIDEANLVETDSARDTTLQVEGLENIMSGSDQNYDTDLLQLGDNGLCFESKKSSLSVQQKQLKPSGKFTIKKAEALGWKGKAKSVTKNVTASLKDDTIFDELMQDLTSPSVVTNVQNITSCSFPKNAQKRKSTMMKGSEKFEEDDILGKLSSESLKEDEVFKSFGIDVPEFTVQKSEGQTSVAAVPIEKSVGVSHHTKVSNQKLAEEKDTNLSGFCYDVHEKLENHDSLNKSDNCALLAALEEDINEQTKSKQMVNDDLSASLGALSPFKSNKEQLKDIEISTAPKTEFRFSDLWQRFKIKNVIFDRHADEKYLTLCNDDNPLSSSFHCTLRGFWVDTKVSEGDVVNIIGHFDGDNRCVIDDRSGILVVSPDFLLSGTCVVSSVFCPRKSVLNEKFKGLDQGNAHMLYGSIIHSLFQTVLKDNLRQQGEIMQMARTLLAAPKFLHAMYSLGVTEATVMEEIKQYIPPLMAWLEKHMAPRNLGRPTHSSLSKAQKSSVVVTDIQDIEENIWSPRFGLKGKIDLTVQAKIQDNTGLVHTKTVPLELKTGKASFSPEHKGQVTLYCMMYGDRREDPGEGLLLYLKTGQMENVQVKPHSISGLIQLRNNLASYFKDHVAEQLDEKGQRSFSVGRLPDPINNQRACEKCAHLLNCSLYQRAVESSSPSPPPPLAPSHPMTRLVPESLSHLDPNDLTYFSHWVTCLQMEDQESNQRHMGPIWNMGSLERENKGDCLSHLTIESSELGIQESQGFNEGKGCSLTFVRHHGHQTGPPLDSVGLSANDAVVVSSEDGRLIALATGFIRTLSQKHVEVVVDRDNLHDISVYKNIVFRLDRNTSFSTSGQLMANLTRLMENSSYASKLRELVISKHKPQSELKIPMAWTRTIKPIFKNLNKPQKVAILKVLMATDYTLIRGFPGTGKTSTIVALVKILHLVGKSVLLTSYTHSAVDNILLKLRRDSIPFLRLGRQARIHPAIRPYSEEILTSSIPSVEELKKFYNSYSVVATSCLGVSHTLFSHRRFDVCIVDEASQVLQPACLGPLFYCQKFVLVGDSQQLAPVVQSKAARSVGMDESLFSRLEKGGATYDLHLQYRMNKVIMAVSNNLVYHGKLKCGNKDVATQCLNLEVSKLEECPDWMKSTLDPELSKSVVFVDLQKSPSVSSKDRKGIYNERESSVAVSLLEALSKASVSNGDMGVISPYRSQVKLLQRRVQCCPLVAGVEVNTVDQYQGRDKSVILVSFALTEDSAVDSAGELLKDIRRLNVAVTRARHKLILIGSSKTLRGWPHLQSIIDDLQTNHCVVQIPPDWIPTPS